MKRVLIYAFHKINLPVSSSEQPQLNPLIYLYLPIHQNRQQSITLAFFRAAYPHLLIVEPQNQCFAQKALISTCCADIDFD